MENDHEIQTLFGPGNDGQSKYRHVGGTCHPFPGGDVSKDVERNGLRRKLRKLIKPDWVFGLVLPISITLLALSNQSAADTVVPSPQLYPKLLFLFGIVFFMALFATFGAALDRRKLDDYYFQLMANGAIIAVVTTISTNLMWGLLDDVFPALSGDELVAVMMVSWSLGYFFYRIRGLNT